MSFLKLLAVFVLSVSMLGLAACTSGDLSGTAGEVPPADEPERPEEPVPPVEPGGEEPVVGGGSGSTAPGGSTSPGGPGVSEPQDLESYLAQKSAERIDLAQVEKDCEACLPEAQQLFDDIKALCETNVDACTPEYQVFLTKERTTAQVRNEQNTVGLPTGEQLLDAMELIKEGGEVGVEEPRDVVELPSRETVDTVANIVTSLEGTGITEATWADIAAAAIAAPDGPVAVAEIEAAFVAVANGDLEVEHCDADCVALVNGLLGGESTPVMDIAELLEKFVGDR